MSIRTITITLLGLCFGLIASVPGSSEGQAHSAEGLDSDGDGIVDSLDVCPTNPFGVAVDSEGRPLGDIDKNCATDLNDFRLMQLGWTGVAEFDAVGAWDAFYYSGENFTYYGRFTFNASHLVVIDAVVASYPDPKLYYTVEWNTGTIASGGYFFNCAFSGAFFFDGTQSMILTLHPLNGCGEKVLYLYRS